jgi:hypothetical protein
MQSNPTANQICGRAIGALFFTLFGTVWLLLALYARQTLTPLNLAAVLLGGLFLASFSILLTRRARQFLATAQNPATSRAFSRVNAIQWIAVAVVAFTFARLHISAYVLSAVTIIVGLHMFPLARIFRYGMHYVSGTALTLWGLASMFIVPVERLQSATAFGTGILLWLSAAATIALAYRLTQNRSAMLQAHSRYTH